MCIYWQKNTIVAEEEFSKYTCYTCSRKFDAAVSLLRHAQYQHQQNIFSDAPKYMAGSAYLPSASPPKECIGEPLVRYYFVLNALLIVMLGLEM